MTTEASATTEDEKQQRAPGPAVNNYKIDFAANVSARDASVIASISLQFSVPLDTLRKPLLIQLPTCGRGRGRCEAVMEADSAGSFLRCVKCDCVAPYPPAAVGRSPRHA